MKRWLRCTGILTVKRTLKLTLNLLAIALLCLSYPIAAWSQDLPESGEILSPPTVRSPSGLENISSEKLNQFVQAYLRVTMLIEQREAELQGAETNGESLQVQREIEAAALAEIDAAGLTLQEYLQLLRLANLDPEFGERVAIQLQEAAD